MAIQVRDQQGNKVNKYINECIIQGNYSSYGWEDICTYYKGGLKDYDNNERGIAHRVINRRSINPIWLHLKTGVPLSTFNKFTDKDMDILINKQ